MLRLVLLLAGLRGLLASGLGKAAERRFSRPWAWKGFSFPSLNGLPASVRLWPNAVRSLRPLTCLLVSFARSPWKLGRVWVSGLRSDS